MDSFNQNQSNYDGMGQMPQMNTQSTPGFTKYLILSILQMLCCCQITGIIALVFTILANSAFKIGNLAEYQSKIKGAKTTLIVGLIVAAVIYIIFIIVYLGAFGIALLSEL